MSDRVAIITGASQGIGAGLVDAYIGMGYSVVANSRTIEGDDRGQVHVVRGDIAEVTTAERIVGEALERFGRIDTLVNNAGVFMTKPFTAYTINDLNDVLRTNVFGFFNLTQRVIDPMLEIGGGHIVSITTTLVEAALSSVPSVLTSISKGGVTAGSKAVAIEFASRNIRVNDVALGVIATPMHSQANLDQLAQLHPNKRTGTIDDVVRGVLYLEQTPFITGETLHIDGGQSAGH
jgi:NAD(P)-dependent dehydrogenase (short-subunit alcohol dehydrogenase family)